MENQRIKISKEHAANVVDIKMSEETKSLLLCKAMLSDIYDNVSNIVNDQYNKDTSNKMMGNFEDKFFGLNEELLKIIGAFIDAKSVESCHKMM